MMRSRVDRFWWIIPLLVFDVAYYLFVQHLVERNLESATFHFRVEAVVFIFLISLYSVYSVRLSRRLSAKYFGHLRFGKYVFVLALSFLLFLVPMIMVQYGFESVLGQVRQGSYYLNNMILMAFLHVVVGNAATGVIYFKEVADLKTEIANKTKKQAEMELQILRQQMSPHFLFNNLNTLSSLISQSPETAREFVSKLAALYRYATQVSRDDVVGLWQEIEFARDYFRLIELRFGDVYTLNVAIDEATADKYYIMPMAMQTILENAMKHNTATKTKPLVISIALSDDFLTVKNTHNPKKVTGDSLGIGLNNLTEQSKLLTGKETVTISDNQYFTIQVPLINKI